MHKNIFAAKCCPVIQICFANVSLSFSSPSTPQWHSRKAVSLLVLLTRTLCVDERFGLMAQCAFLIEAAPLLH